MTDTNGKGARMGTKNEQRRSRPIDGALSRPVCGQLDFSLSKRIPINKARLEFRWEVFNLLNHVNFGTPDFNISNVTVGTITTAADGRAMQFGLRFVW
jgi:hypothetical protein